MFKKRASVLPFIHSLGTSEEKKVSQDTYMVMTMMFHCTFSAVCQKQYACIIAAVFSSFLLGCLLLCLTKAFYLGAKKVVHSCYNHHHYASLDASISSLKEGENWNMWSLVFFIHAFFQKLHPVREENGSSPQVKCLAFLPHPLDYI